VFLWIWLSFRVSDGKFKSLCVEKFWYNEKVKSLKKKI
jgi:hypothetical protein